MPRIDMMQVHSGGVGRLFFPQMRQRAGQQAQHAAHPLEIAERRGLGGQGRQHLGVQGVAQPERLDGFGPRSLGGERLAAGRP